MFRRREGGFVLALALVLATCAAWSGGASLGAAQASLPTGRGVIDKYVEAIGGAAAVAQVSSLHVKGQLDTPDGTRGTFEMYRARPSKLLLRVTIPSVGVQLRGYDGKVGWESGYSGHAVLTGRRLNELIHDAQFDTVLRAPGLVREATTTNQTKFGGRPAYRVKVVYASGVDQIEYFDTETGLLLGWEGMRDLGQPIGVVPTVSVTTSYRVFGALRQPVAEEQRSLGLLQKLTMDTYAYNGVDPAVFELPAAIKALVR